MKPQDYMNWAKTHPRGRFDLTFSGVPTPKLDVSAVDWSAPRRDAYGDRELIDLIATRYGVPAECVLPAPGTSSANLLAMRVAVNPGEAILIERPTYQPLFRAAEFLGLRIAWYERPPCAGFRPDFDALEKGLISGARAVLIADIHNPSGLRLPKPDLIRLADLCRRHGAALIVDEVYLDFAHVNRSAPLTTAALLGDPVIATSSLTKVYGFGDLRCGWMLATPEVISRARAWADAAWVNLPQPTARAGVAILRTIEQYTAVTKTVFAEAYPIFEQWLRSHPDLLHYGNDGAIFQVLGLADRCPTEDFVRELEARYEVSVVPGRHYGMPEHFRLGFCLPGADLAEALARIDAALQRRA